MENHVHDEEPHNKHKHLNPWIMALFTVVTALLVWTNLAVVGEIDPISQAEPTTGFKLFLFNTSLYGFLLASTIMLRTGLGSPTTTTVALLVTWLFYITTIGQMPPPDIIGIIIFTAVPIITALLLRITDILGGTGRFSIPEIIQRMTIWVAPFVTAGVISALLVLTGILNT